MLTATTTPPRWRWRAARHHRVEAEVLPDGKSAVIGSPSAGPRGGDAGDGVGDALALAAADVGIAMAPGPTSRWKAPARQRGDLRACAGAHPGARHAQHPANLFFAGGLAGRGVRALSGVRFCSAADRRVRHVASSVSVISTRCGCGSPAGLTANAHRSRPHAEERITPRICIASARVGIYFPISPPIPRSCGVRPLLLLSEHIPSSVDAKPHCGEAKSIERYVLSRLIDPALDHPSVPPRSRGDKARTTCLLSGRKRNGSKPARRCRTRGK